MRSRNGKVIHGLRVLGGHGSLLNIHQWQRVEDVLISSSRFLETRIREIVEQCEAASVAV